MTKDRNDNIHCNETRDGSHSSKRSVSFRSWFYFRTGYAEYFVFLFGAVNTLTLMYYLLIDNYPDLQSLFSSFTIFVALTTLIMIPILILVGYIHMHRSSAYRSQIEINVESSPYIYKLPPGLQQEVMAPMLYEILGTLKKINAGDALTPKEIENMQNLDEKLGFLIGGGILRRPENFGGV